MKLNLGAFSLKRSPSSGGAKEKRARKKKPGSISRSEASSFGSKSSDDSVTTPTSVIPASGGGSLTRKQLEAVLRRLGPEDEVAEMLADLDSGLSIEEIGELAAGAAEAESEEMRVAFAAFDANGDGRISAEELLEVMRVIGDECSIEDCRRMIRGVDLDCDGFVCFRDFVRMMDGQLSLTA